MAYPIILSQGWSKFAEAVDDEVHNARQKFPNQSRKIGMALMEETGEVARALLNFSYGEATEEEVQHEIVQTAAMCVRLFHEGDADFGFHPGCKPPPKRR